MAKKLITLSMNQKLLKLNFSDVKKVISRKPRKCPNIPYFDKFYCIKEEQKTEEIEDYKEETSACLSSN